MKIKDIVTLGVVGAAELRDLAAAGDEQAKQKYLMYSAWKKTLTQAKELNLQAGYKAFSNKDCVKVLIALGQEIGVQWQT